MSFPDCYTIQGIYVLPGMHNILVSSDNIDLSLKKYRW